MEFLLRSLDDPSPHRCGKCANCKSKGLPTSVSHDVVVEAEIFLKSAQVLIEPRKQWPVGLFPDEKRNILPEYQNAPGRSLCYYGDAGWGQAVRAGKYHQGYFSSELLDASVHLIRDLWKPDPWPTWVTAITSVRHPILVPEFAARLAQKLGLPFVPALRRIGDAQEQKTMQNSTMQARNVIGTLNVDGSIPHGPVLLIDDIIDSGWTLTMAGYLLRKSGSGLVYPYTLARAAGRNSNG